MHMHRQWKIKLRETFGLSVYSIELKEAKLDRILQGDWWEKIERSETSGDNEKIEKG